MTSHILNLRMRYIMAQQKISTMNLCDAKAHFSEVVRRVEKGESITILKHHVPVMRLIPVLEEKKHKYTKAEAIEQILALGKMNSLDGLTVQELRDEGRKY